MSQSAHLLKAYLSTHQKNKIETQSTALKTRSSADADGLHDTSQIRKITLEKACNG